jgi:hypothetical protein
VAALNTERAMTSVRLSVQDARTERGGYGMSATLVMPIWYRGAQNCSAGSGARKTHTKTPTTFLSR